MSECSKHHEYDRGGGRQGGLRVGERRWEGGGLRVGNRRREERVVGGEEAVGGRGGRWDWWCEGDAGGERRRAKEGGSASAREIPPDILFSSARAVRV